MSRKYFGTDGIRGRVGESPITPDFVLRLGYAAGRVLAQYGKVAPVNSVMRVIYAETAATGQGVTEAGDAKAAQEARDLWAYVQGLLNG